MLQRTSLARSTAKRFEQNSLPAGLIGAAALHALIVAAMFVTWSHTIEIDDQSPPVVPVDLVTIGEKTNVQAMVKQAPKEPPKEEEVQPPAPEQAQATPAAPQQEEAAPPPDETAAEKVKPMPPPPPVPEQKPQPEKKKDKFDIDNIMALLDKRAPAAQSAPNAKVGPKTFKGIGAQNAMTMDLVDALRNQIAQCWSPPVGAPHPEQLIVQFELYLNPDGSVSQPPQLMSGAGDTFARAAAEAARRAIFQCQPYRLPADRYNQWRDIQMTFDPRRMVGQ